MLKIDQDTLPFLDASKVDEFGLSESIDGDKSNGVIVANTDPNTGGIDFNYGASYPFTKSIELLALATDSGVLPDPKPKTTEFRFLQTDQNTPAVGIACLGFADAFIADSNFVFHGLCVDFTNNAVFIARVTNTGDPLFENVYEEHQRIDNVDVFAPMRFTFDGTIVRADINGVLVEHDFVDFGLVVDALPKILGSGIESALTGMTLNKWSLCDVSGSLAPNAYTVDDCNHILSIAPPAPAFTDQPLLGSVSVEPFGYLSQAPLLLTNNTQEVRLAGLAGSTSKEAIVDASVSLALVLEQNNNTIIDSVPMSYDEGSQSYRALLDGSLLVRGLIYTLTVKAVKGSSVGEWRQTLKAQDRLLEVVGSGAKLY